jgi:hypothetical protein
VEHQPGAVLEHLPGDSEEPLLVDAPRVPKPDADAHQEQGQREQQKEMRVGVGEVTPTAARGLLPNMCRPAHAASRSSIAD